MTSLRQIQINSKLKWHHKKASIRSQATDLQSYSHGHWLHFIFFSSLLSQADIWCYVERERYVFPQTSLLSLITGSISPSQRLLICIRKNPHSIRAAKAFTYVQGSSQMTEIPNLLGGDHARNSVNCIVRLGIRSILCGFPWWENCENDIPEGNCVFAVKGDVYDWRMSTVFSLKFCIFIKQSRKISKRQQQKALRSIWSSSLWIWPIAPDVNL